MILSDYKDFPQLGRIIGVDWGLRRCGIAVSDEKRTFVFTRPAVKVNNQAELVDFVVKMLDEPSMVGVVIGLPLFSDGSESDTTKMVRDFANILAQKTDKPILFMEENLTSYVAQQEIGRKPISKIKQELDSQSAKIILENAIAMLNRA